MFPIPDFVYKLATVVLLPVCVFLFIGIWAVRANNTKLTEENDGLRQNIAEIKGKVSVQNQAIDELQKSTEAYKAKLAAAKAKNEESQRKLEQSLEEVRKLKLPKDCDGKVRVLKDELVKSVAGWTP